MKLGNRPKLKRTSSMLQHPRLEAIIIPYQEWSWEGGPASRGQVQYSSIQVQKVGRNNHNVRQKMKLGPRPSFKGTRSMLQHPSPETRMTCYQKWSWAAGPASKDKFNAPTSKSRKDHHFLLRVKPGRRPSFQRTSPMFQHPSPETIMICAQKWSWAAGPASRRQVQWPIIQVQKQ